MKLIAFLALILLTNPELEGLENNKVEKIQFTGTVIEELTGEPIPGATIHIIDPDQKIYTDFEGNFTFDNLTPGIYDLEVSFVSFGKKELKDLEISEKQHSLLIRLD